MGSNPHPPSHLRRESSKASRGGKRRNSQHSAVFRPQAGNGAVLGISELVPVVGLEPTRYHYQRILSPSRLPFHHTGELSFIIQEAGAKFKGFAKNFDCCFSVCAPRNRNDAFCALRALFPYSTPRLRSGRSLRSAQFRRPLFLPSAPSKSPARCPLRTFQKVFAPPPAQRPPPVAPHPAPLKAAFFPFSPPDAAFPPLPVPRTPPPFPGLRSGAIRVIL